MFAADANAVQPVREHFQPHGIVKGSCDPVPDCEIRSWTLRWPLRWMSSSRGRDRRAVRRRPRRQRARRAGTWSTCSGSITRARLPTNRWGSSSPAGADARRARAPPQARRRHFALCLGLLRRVAAALAGRRRLLHRRWAAPPTRSSRGRSAAAAVADRGLRGAGREVPAVRRRPRRGPQADRFATPTSGGSTRSGCARARVDREEATRARRDRRSATQGDPVVPAAGARAGRPRVDVSRRDRLDVGDFVIGEPSATRWRRARKPREQLLVMEDDRRDGARAVHPSRGAREPRHARSAAAARRHNLGDFLLAVEGVSHFIYAIPCARAERPCQPARARAAGRGRQVRHVPARDRPGDEQRARCASGCSATALTRTISIGDERERYRAANDNAQRYAAWLEERSSRARRIPEMLGELRRFYRKGLAAKLATIARAA